jgi:integration host factor subunit beta
MSNYFGKTNMLRKEVANMNKSELIQELRRQANITKSEAEAVVELFFAEMSSALSKEGRVEIQGFCSFYVEKYKSYAGRSPNTGEKVKVKTRKLPFFKCGQELNKRVNSP